uniref:Transposon n=2 Tax=Methylobacterium oryzae TaxID=334852 RepID=A0A088B352_9HYPH|nr:Putative transposon [Methylobacterium oryzae CBMB20]
MKANSMQLITAEQRAALLANGAASAKRDIDPHPVVNLFTPDAGATWLLTELDPTEPDIAFGLCDLGLGCPELGYVRLSELQTVRGKLGLPVERDLWFEAKGPLSAYAAAAHRAEHIVELEPVA